MYPDRLLKFIPPYFDLSHYEETANMGLIHWVDNLMNRAKPYRCVMDDDQGFEIYKCDGESDKDKSFYEFVSGGLSEKEQFEKNVIENILGGASVDENMHNYVQNIFIEEKTNSTAIVREMNHVDLLSLNKNKITQRMKEKYSNSERSIIPSFSEKSFGDLSEPIYSYGLSNEVEFSWLKVDMSSSDAEIKTAFNEWLKQHRQSEKSIIKQKRRVHKLKNINETTLRKWHEARVLAYIDLVTWNYSISQKVTSIALGEILFPDPKIGSDRAKMIDDTTKPYAEKLTSQRFLRRAIKVVVNEKRKKTI